MIVAGVPRAVDRKITGRRTDSMFRRYAVVNEEQKREVLAKTGPFRRSHSSGDYWGRFSPVVPR